VSIAATAIPAWEAAALAADSPLFVADHVRRSDPVGRWAAGSGAFGTSPDVSDPDAPSWAALDRYATIPSGPTGPAATGWTFVVDCRFPGLAIDVLAWVGAMWGATVTHTVEAADDALFTSGVVTLDTWSSGAERGARVLGSRYVADALGGWVRWRMSAAGAFLPRVGELWLGRRRQMQGRPLRPWAPSSRRAGLEGTRETWRAPWTGRWEADVEVWARQALADDGATIAALAREADGFAAPLLYLPTPATAPADVRLVVATQHAEIEMSDPADVRVRLGLRELPPFGGA
jgi:hypothetical protein